MNILIVVLGLHAVCIHGNSLDIVAIVFVANMLSIFLNNKLNKLILNKNLARTLKNNPQQKYQWRKV